MTLLEEPQRLDETLIGVQRVCADEICQHVECSFYFVDPSATDRRGTAATKVPPFLPAHAKLQN